MAPDLATALEPPEIFLARCLSLNDLFFLLIITLNLSKSVKLALLALTANFFDYEVAAHFSLSLYASACFLNKNYGLINLLDGSSSGTFENTWNSKSGEGESSEWVEDTGETTGGSFDEDSGSVGDVNNNNYFA